MRLTGRVQEDIAGLDVAVQQLPLVSVMDRPRRRRRQPGRRLRIVLVSVKVLRQAAAFDQLHGEEMQAGVFADFVDRNDMRMVEPRRLVGLLAKAAHVFRSRPVRRSG